MSPCQPTREDIKTDNGWAWLDKVLAEEVAYVSVSEEDNNECYRTTSGRLLYGYD